mmetsp:Transcript_8513/g.25543  ORF Transcript_8513/g.25543 Transcript_8513/m.25543 type:complete len:229 (-) Transcript_8513:627-1313(-)|eukprot:CAMPEP_0206144142 /NCGR_PEP_ID=MMETSP1473-20131121/23160_1 /ASSEMBLY_ACC=CAM_ASM_001109 /TAXON_ID=1461547 /ORGANISM="Stichococcus sp, Strain RCC1054" /LENGTH=228 /DNA_ID=CAMNT_0053539861 /DNA_START=115 /DNA_END=801 /DNA_ORIENTATION=+
MPAMADLGSAQLSLPHIAPRKVLQDGEPDFYDDAQPDGQLMDLDWASELRSAPGMEPVMTAGALLSPDSSMPADHLFTALLHHKLLQDLTCLFDRPARQLHALVAFGSDVCGHGGLVHGGMSATVMDETFGALVYMLKRAGELGDGPAFTAHLEVDYKKPLPAPSSVVCTARVLSVEGRKIWLAAEVLDRPGGTLFAQGKALFLTMKPARAADPTSPKSVAPAAVAQR